MIITRTPLRISFTGGGTDIKDYYQMNGGAVVNMTINKYIYITVNKKFDNKIRASYSKTEIVDNVQDLHHELLRECLRMVGITGGIEITSIADIPSGTGLGSSSSFTVGVLNALFTYKGVTLSAQQLAEKACEIEIDVLKHPIGKQDQYAAAFGGLNYLQFNTDGSVSREKIECGEEGCLQIERKLMLFYTGITRSANSILSEQKRNIDSKREALDFMCNQAHQMYHELSTNGFTEKFADALNQGWQKKQTLASAIVNTDIHDLYDRAMTAGAKGGKLLGAGGGGFLLFYCKEEDQNAVKKAIGLREMSFLLDLHGSKVVYFV